MARCSASLTSRPIVPYRILGQGIVGSLVALELLDAGASVTVVDRWPRRCASLVSAGMIDPISGQRFAKSWNYVDNVAIAISTYRSIERRFNISILRERPIYRLFRDDKDKNTYLKKRDKGELEGVIAAEFDTSPFPEVHAPYGGIQVTGGYVVDVETIIQTLHAFFVEQGIYEITLPTQPTNPSTITLHCTGAYAAHSNLFSWLPFRNSRGECIRFSWSPSHANGIINNGFWITPRGNGQFKAGATYSWDDLFRSPTRAGYHHIQRYLDSVIPRSLRREFTVESGTRSIMCDTRAVVGPHPKIPTEWIISGVGSKGTLIAPFIAQNVKKSLLFGTKIHPDISIQRFIKKYWSTHSIDIQSQ